MFFEYLYFGTTLEKQTQCLANVLTPSEHFCHFAIQY